MRTNKEQNNSYFKVLSQLPVTKTFISGIQAISLMGASCMATVTGWPPDIKDHIFACLSQPPEKTVVPSSFQAEQSTFSKEWRQYAESIYENILARGNQTQTNRSDKKPKLDNHRLVMWDWRLGHTSYRSPIPRKFPAPYLHRFSRQQQRKINGRQLKAGTQHSISACKVSAGRDWGVQTWLSHEVATKWLALGLKLRLETESLGGWFTWPSKICILSLHSKELSQKHQATSTIENKTIPSGLIENPQNSNQIAKSRHSTTCPSWLDTRTTYIHELQLAEKRLSLIELPKTPRANPS